MSQSTTIALTCACPECAAEVRFQREPRRHEVVRCSSCSADLEVTGLDPITVELAPEVEEDWGE